MANASPRSTESLLGPSVWQHLGDFGFGLGSLKEALKGTLKGALAIARRPIESHEPSMMSKYSPCPKAPEPL